MFEDVDQARQQLKASIVRQAVKLSPNRLQVHVAARYRSVDTSFTVANAMGTRMPDLMSGYTDAVVFGVLEKYEAGLAGLLDARLAELAALPPADVAGEIERMRASLKTWGDEGRADWRFRNPWPQQPAHATTDPHGRSAS